MNACTCGQPNTPGVVHRSDGPCYHTTHTPPPTPVSAERGIPQWANGAALIANERARQMTKEGWSPEHDDTHRDGSLRVVAAMLACQDTDAHVEDPLDRTDWKLGRHPIIRRLVIAGALLAAEIDRVLRRDSTASPASAYPRETEGRGETPTQAEALEIATRFINGHFGNAGERPRASIPADPLRDDDIRLIAFIQSASPTLPASASLPESAVDLKQAVFDIQEWFGGSHEDHSNAEVARIISEYVRHLVRPATEEMAIVKQRNVRITVSGYAAYMPRFSTDADVISVFGGCEMRNLLRESKTSHTYDVIPRLSRIELQDGDSFIYAPLAVGESLSEVGHYENGRLTTKSIVGVCPLGDMPATEKQEGAS